MGRIENLFAPPQIAYKQIPHIQISLKSKKLDLCKLSNLLFKYNNL